MTYWPRNLLIVAGAALLLAGCASPPPVETLAPPPVIVAPEAPPLDPALEDVDLSATAFQIGKPYKVRGQTFTPRVDWNYEATGLASWYSPKFHGKRTANGERYDRTKMTAAHPTLPLPSFVRVENLENGKSVVLRVNDRGPFTRGRIIDVSEAAAEKLGIRLAGTGQVRVSILAEQSKQAALKAGYRD